MIPEKPRIQRPPKNTPIFALSTLLLSDVHRVEILAAEDLGFLLHFYLFCLFVTTVNDSVQYFYIVVSGSLSSGFEQGWVQYLSL